MRDFEAYPDDPPAPTPTSTSAPSPWQRLWRWLRAESGAQRVAVARLNDHTLRDIGLTRSEAQARFARHHDPRL